jgi:hypothetical protein
MIAPEWAGSLSRTLGFSRLPSIINPMVRATAFKSSGQSTGLVLRFIQSS